jgi:hypothetical protein
MLDVSGAIPSRPDRLRELLLGYLFAAGLPDWPGADGITLDAMLCLYPRYAAAARVPDRHRLLLGHPELCDEIEAFFQQYPGE